MSQQYEPTSTAEAVGAAARHVREGGLAVLPTDTVYGIGCSATSAPAVSRLLAAKERGVDRPPPVLVASVQDLDVLVARLPQAARRLVEVFWPGPLTLVLDADPTAEPGLGWDLEGTGGTVAVRVPAHPTALALLRLTGPMAVTSANRTGDPPATDAQQVRAAFPGRLRPAGILAGGLPADGPAAQDADILLLDAGPTPGPLASTIVDVSGRWAASPRILRHGVVGADQVAAAAEGRR